MRKILTLLTVVIATLISLPVFAQPMATEGKVDHTKGNKIAAAIEIPYSPEVTEAAIKDYLASKGVKSDKSKGFNIFRSVKINEDDAERHDLHFKVERKSRKEKDISMVYLLVGRPGENVGQRTSNDRHKLDEAKSFLNNIVPSVDAYDLEVKIKEQEEIVKKTGKKLTDYSSDQKELEKKIEDLQEKLEENKINQQKQTDEVTKQKTVLDAMKGRRKS